MTLWPYDKFEVITHISGNEVKKRLSSILTPVSTYSFLNPNKSSNVFEGEINGDRFKIEKIVNGKNPFNPVIDGSISKLAAGCKLSFSIRLPWVALTLVIFLLLIFLITSYYKSWHDEGHIYCSAFLAIILITFKYSSIKSKNILIKLFEAEGPK